MYPILNFNIKQTCTLQLRSNISNEVKKELIEKAVKEIVDPVTPQPSTCLISIASAAQSSTGLTLTGSLPGTSTSTSSTSCSFYAPQPSLSKQQKYMFQSYDWLNYDQLSQFSASQTVQSSTKSVPSSLTS
jgi:hypothetical protein